MTGLIRVWLFRVELLLNCKSLKICDLENTFEIPKNKLRFCWFLGTPQLNLITFGGF